MRGDRGDPWISLNTEKRIIGKDIDREEGKANQSKGVGHYCCRGKKKPDPHHRSTQMRRLYEVIGGPVEGIGPRCFNSRVGTSVLPESQWEKTQVRVAGRKENLTIVF